MTGYRYDHGIDLAACPARVWAYTTDLARTPEWRTTITSIRPPQELRVGERFSGTTRLLGRTWRWELEVSAVEPEQHFAYDVVKGMAKPGVGYRIEPSDAGCRFTMSGSIDEINLAGRVLVPLALRALHRETVVHLDHLRRIVESGGDRPSR